MEETFEYNGVELKHVEQHNDKCAGCYFWEHNIPCVPKNIPECKSGIFVEITE